MSLRCSCDACGRLVLGIFTRLKLENGRYLCPECVGSPIDGARFYCATCKTFSARCASKGSGWIELVLYFFWIVPGILYSLWRRTGRTRSCPRCGAGTILDLKAGGYRRCPACLDLIPAGASKCSHCGTGIEEERR